MGDATNKLLSLSFVFQTQTCRCRFPRENSRNSINFSANQKIDLTKLLEFPPVQFNTKIDAQCSIVHLAGPRETYLRRGLQKLGIKKRDISAMYLEETWLGNQSIDGELVQKGNLR